MNKITNSERERIHGRAMEIVRLDIDNAVLDKHATVGALMDEFSISQQRAVRHVAAAAQALRSVAAGHAAVYKEKRDALSGKLSVALAVLRNANTN